MNRARVGLLPHLIEHCCDRAVDFGIAACIAWIKWFWRLGPAATFVALAAHVVAAFLAVSWVSLGHLGVEFVGVFAFVLGFFAITSLLFGRPDHGASR